jgi:hypothetical protein
VWRALDGTSAQSPPRIARYANGAWNSISPPHIPFIVSSNLSLRASIAANPLGDVALIWNSDNDVMASVLRRTVGQWTAPTTISASAETLRDWRIAVDNDGNALAVWIRDIGGVATMFSRRYDATAQTWSAAIELETNALSNLNVTFNAQGDAVVAWAKVEGNQTNFYSRIYTRTANTWSNAARINTQNYLFASELKVAIDHNRDLLAVWYGTDATGITTFQNRYNASNGTWGTSAVLGIDRNGENSAPQLAMNASGNAVAIWWHRTSEITVSVHSRRYSAATREWGPTVPIGAPVNGSGGYQHLTSLGVGMDAAGNAIAVRLHGTYSVNHFAVHRYVAATNVWETANVARNVNGYGPARLATHPRGNAFVVISDWGGSAFGLEFVTFR